MKHLLVILLLFTASFIYGQQTIYDTIIHDGLQRSYILYVPDSYQHGQETPLIINFHGYTSNAFEQMNYGDFRDIADTAGFLLVHPMGTLDNSGNPYWNANWGGDVDDIGFTEALIDSLASEYSINLDRVFSTGMSNGGFMSYTLACELSHRIAAIASVTGTMNLNQSISCNPQHPMPVMEIHGTFDFVVPYNGNSFMESIPNTLAYWTAFNNCDSDPMIEQLPDLEPGDGCTAELHSYPNGSNGVEVKHFKIINGGHTWPGSPFPSGGGNTNQDINASAEIWKFFHKYDIDGLMNTTAVKSPDDLSNTINISPNPAKNFISINWENENIQWVRILNQQGILITKQDVSNHFELKINSDDFIKGMYFIQFYDKNNRLLGNEKLMVH